MKMKEHSKLKKLIKYYYATSRDDFSSLEVKMSARDLRYLHAKGLIKIVPYYPDDPNCHVTILDKAFTYYEDRRKELFLFWFPVTTSLVSLGVAILAYLKQ